jgi:hypothetical protein
MADMPRPLPPRPASRRSRERIEAASQYTKTGLCAGSRGQLVGRNAWIREGALGEVRLGRLMVAIMT